MRRTTLPPSLHQLLTAAAILLGVLAMHAVSGGPHSSRGGDHAMASSPPAAGALVVPDVVPDVMPSVVPDAPELPMEPSAALAAMCVAILLSMAVALRLRGRGRVLGRAPCPPQNLVVARRNELTRAPPSDLLTRLCVLRT